jgi:hypothetical protein
MILTNIQHEIELRADAIKLETKIVKTLEHNQLDFHDQEQVISWYADICKKARWFGFIGDDDSRLRVSPKLNQFSVEDWFDQDQANGIQYNVWVETTLDNAKAKNPKNWSMRFLISRIDHPAIKHEIQWPRLPNEELNQNGFEQGLQRRNIFATLRKT